MKSSMTLYTDTFGQRILLRRSYLSCSEAKAETVLILSELLNLSFLSQKKGYSSLSGGELFYQVYSYRGGYVLESRLIQTKTKGLSYIFKNPYKSGYEMLVHFDKANLLDDEKSLAVAKERLISKKNFAFSSLSVLLTQVHADYSFPEFDEKKVKDVKIEEVLSALAAFSNSNIGDYVYLGEEDKKDPFNKDSGFEKDLSSLPYSPLLTEGNESLESKDKDGKLYLFKLSTAIESEEDYLNSKQALYVLEEEMKKEIKKGYGSEFSLSTSLLSRSSAYLYVETEKGKLYLLEDKVPLKENEGYILKDESSYDDSFIGFNKDMLSRSIYSFSCLEELKKYKDLNLSLDKDRFFKKVNNEKAKVLSSLKNMEKTGSLSLTNRKDENHD